MQKQPKKKSGTLKSMPSNNLNLADLGIDDFCALVGLPDDDTVIDTLYVEYEKLAGECAGTLLNNSKAFKMLKNIYDMEAFMFRMMICACLIKIQLVAQEVRND